MIAIIVIIVVLLAIVGGMFIAPYNSLVGLRNKLQEAWRQVDVELNRRYDLIPNLVESVKGYATHEHNTLSDIISLRNQARQMDTNGAASAQRGQVEAQLTQALGSINALAEAYPDLKADAGFRQLSEQLAATEDRIANSRRYYNAVVGDYNTKVESFPSNISASMFHFTKAAYFQVDDPSMREAPQVDFSQMGYGSGVQRDGQQAGAPAPGNQQSAPQPALGQDAPGQPLVTPRAQPGTGQPQAVPTEQNQGYVPPQPPRQQPTTGQQPTLPDDDSQGGSGSGASGQNG
ncbi:LemA family protein [Propionibacterium freudenreichii]|uniref:LemA family protein n=1 Tax=Propionibacterium freudenreichii TaxID=1744 RepID=UPI003851B3F3